MTYTQSYANETLLAITHIDQCFNENEFIEYPLQRPEINEIAKITIVKVPELKKVCVHIEIIGIKQFMQDVIKLINEALNGCKIPSGKW